MQKHFLRSDGEKILRQFWHNLCFYGGMEPISTLLLSAGLSAGKALLEKVLPFDSSKVAKGVEKVEKFASVLQGNDVSQTPKSGLVMLLEQNQIQDVGQMNQLRRQLTGQLLANPSLQGALGNAKEVHLKLEDGGNFQLTTDTGKVINLSSNVELRNLAQQIHEMSSVNALDQEFPGNSLRNLVKQASGHPQLAANWTIRQGSGLIA